MGARQFRRICLPRLKYHNPTVSMTVEKVKEQAGPATLTVFFTSSSDPSAKRTNTGQNSNVASERTEAIDIKYRDESEILSELMKITKGQAVIPTGEDQALMQESREAIAKTEQDRRRTRLDYEARQREKRLLEQARRSGGQVGLTPS